MIYQCKNPAKWHPTMHTGQRNHIPPTSWRREIVNQSPNPPDKSAWREDFNCGLCHDEYHNLLNTYVKLDGPPPYEILRTYSVYVRAVVAETWEMRVLGIKMPYTVMKPQGQ